MYRNIDHILVNGFKYLDDFFWSPKTISKFLFTLLKFNDKNLKIHVLEYSLILGIFFCLHLKHFKKFNSKLMSGLKYNFFF